MIGVYSIVNTLSNDLYIGSAVNIKYRWRRHRKDLESNGHHSIVLQRAYNKYGKEAFRFEVLEECSRDQLVDLEQGYLDKLSPKYNICRFAYSSLGRKDSKETIEKKRKWAIDNNISPPPETWKKKQKKVTMIKNGKELKTFNSLSEACRFLGKDSTYASTITRAIKRNIKAYTYNWKFYESKDD